MSSEMGERERCAQRGPLPGLPGLGRERPRRLGAAPVQPRGPNRRPPASTVTRAHVPSAANTG